MTGHGRGGAWAGHRPAWRALVAVVIALSMSASAARAQLEVGGPLLQRPPAEDAPEVELVPAYETGSDVASIPDERFVPMILRIGPGRVQGVAVIEHRQDATQAARTVARFAATPGRWTELPLTLVLPDGLAELRVALFAIDGGSQRHLRTETFDVLSTTRDDENAIRVDPWARLIGQIGSSSLEAAARSAALVDGREDTDPTHEVIAGLAPGRVPESAIAFDAFELVVVRASEAMRLSTGQVGALRGWVRSGGRLLVVADEPGRAWARLVAAGDRSPVGVLDPAEAPLPEPLGELLTPEATEPVRAPWRGVSITERGARQGWRVTWLAGDGSGDGGSVGALAHGPVGLGWVGIMGLEPGAAVPSASGEALVQTWREVVAPALLLRHEDHDSRFQAFALGPGMGVQGSGATDRERMAIGASASMAVELPRLGHAPFVAIAVSMVVLALLVGPVDMLALKRMRARHHSWLTALLWTGAATLVALLAPHFIRENETRIGSVRCVDLIVEGEAGEASASRGWEAELIGVFAGPPISGTLKEAPGESAWRGVSPLGSLRRRASFDALTLMSGSGLGGPLLVGALSQGMWTYRTLMRFGPVRSPLHASVAEIPGGEWSVVLTGLAEDERVEDAWLHVGSSRAPIELSPWAGTGLRASVAFELDPSRFDESESRWMAAPDAEERSRSMRNIAHLVGVTAATGLPGAADRSAGFERYLEAGGWAVVHLVIGGGSSPVELGVSGERQAQRVVRLLAPIERVGGRAPMRENGP